jgi:glycosidase
MDFTGFHHETKSRYAYPADAHTLHLRLRTGLNCGAEKITLVIFDPSNWVERNGKYVFNTEGCQYIPMECEQRDKLYACWFAEARLPTKRAKYAFITEGGGERFFYGCGSITPFADDAALAEMTHLCFIYPYILEEDIFRAPSWVKDTVWYQIFPSSYAGDLPGVTARLDELRDFGITGIYFTPVFTSPSKHKYNTGDYFQIDPSFGDNAALGHLVDEAHKRGIRVMLDLVFNHIGSTHPWWRDVLRNGKASRYYSCFYVHSEPVTPGGYETFAFVPNMPKWNTSDPLARAYLLDVASYWARTYEVDGFRLDVANEVSHDFWRVFRKTVRAVNPLLYIVGEVWDDAMPWLGGDQWDASMHYPLAMAIWGFVSGKLNGAGLRDALASCLTMYPKPVQQTLFNLIGTHDTSRIMTVAKNSAERVIQAFTLLLTFTGSPCIYYGDEIGLTGEGMDNARAPMLFDGGGRDLKLKAFVKKLIELRNEHGAFKSPDVRFLHADERGVVYTKDSGDETVLVMLNATDAEQSLPLPDGNRIAADLLNGGQVELTGRYTLPPYGTVVLQLAARKEAVAY